MTRSGRTRVAKTWLRGSGNFCASVCHVAESFQRSRRKMSAEELSALLDGKVPTKIITVPPRLVNLVVV